MDIKMEITIDNFKDLRLFSAIYTAEHDNLSKDDRVQILNFIKEANEPQLMFLLQTGSMVNKESEELNEVASVTAFGSVFLKLSQGEANIAAALAAGAIAYFALKTAIAFVKKKECKQYSVGSPTYARCKKRVKVDQHQKTIEVMNNKIDLCNNAGNPHKCQFRVRKKILGYEHKINKLNADIQDLSGKIKY